jgi:2-C-methyl-D-erythritol 4-phosphate cytidylyltransferase
MRDAVVILVGAGRGERLGQPKAFLDLAGVSLLERTGRALLACPLVEALVLVVSADAVPRAQALGLPRVHAVVPGGARRQDSVQAGLAALPPGFDGVVLVHDAARPFVGSAVIAAVIAAAAEQGAALPVVPIVDTVKRVRDGRVVETIDRATLGAAQTPQGFRASLLRRAYQAAERDGVTVTDEAAAVERLGLPVAVVAGAPDNRKITTPEDLDWALGHLARVPA